MRQISRTAEYRFFSFTFFAQGKAFLGLAG